MSQTLIEKLGFERDDKVVILHIDDIAMSHAANEAAFECLEFGIATCGSVIAVSGWLMEAINLWKRNPKLDIGVHLTLTSEYDVYRWRPLSSIDEKTGLFDKEGYLWHTTEEAVTSVTPEAAEKEMRSQIEICLRNGLDVTHIDTHMGTVVHPKFVERYIQLSYQYQIPAFLPKLTRYELEMIGYGQYIDYFLSKLHELEDKGYPLIDNVVFFTLNEQEDKVSYYVDVLESLKPGLTHLLFHPAKMSSELSSLANNPVARNQDYEAFTSKKLKDYLESSEIKTIGYRRLREYFRDLL